MYNHSTSSIRIPDGPKLFTRKWLPEGSPKAALLLLHGLDEHSARYHHVATFLNDAGFAVYSYDQRGHGESEGKRIYINNFSEYVDDLSHIYKHVLAETEGLPLFFLAHSMGTTVTLRFLLDHKPAIAGAVLSGTAIMAGDDISPLLISMSGIIGAIAPKLPTISLNSSTLSRDATVVQKYMDDPLISNAKIPARTGAELNRIFKTIQADAHKIDIPLLIMHGTADELSNPEGSTLLYKTVSSTDKTLKMWDGLYHEIFNEPEQEEVLSLATTWLTTRI